MDKRVTEFAAADAAARFSELLARAEAGEEISIQRDGRTVARLGPARAAMTVEERRQAQEKYLAWREAHGPTLGPDLTIRDLINEGRRF